MALDSRAEQIEGGTLPRLNSPIGRLMLGGVLLAIALVGGGFLAGYLIGKGDV